MVTVIRYKRIALDIPIRHVRGHAVMLDNELAMVYGVPTHRFNEAVKRNVSKFPKDFRFQLTYQEVMDLISQNAISKTSQGGRRKLPWAFTEYGAFMAATVLSSERAVAMSIYVVRAFVKMRGALLANVEMEARLQKIEKVLLLHDSDLRDLFERIKLLLLPSPGSGGGEMGFHTRLKKLKT